MSTMITGTYISLIIFFIALIFFILDFWFMSVFDKERRTGQGWSWDYTLFIFAIVFILVFQPIFFPILSWTTNHSWGLLIQILGILLAVFSFLLHLWARQHLRHFYTERVEIQEKHQIIKTGPYKYVRHPIIATFFGLAISVFLINPSILTILVIGYTFWDFLGAAKQEETALKKTFPDYADYMAVTPPFLPRIWKRK